MVTLFTSRENKSVCKTGGRRNTDTNATSKLLVTCDCDEAEELAVRFEVDGRAVPRDIRQDGRDDAYERICDARS